jgi:hypothetical protein
MEANSVAHATQFTDPEGLLLAYYPEKARLVFGFEPGTPGPAISIWLAQKCVFVEAPGSCVSVFFFAFLTPEQPYTLRGLDLR